MGRRETTVAVERQGEATDARVCLSSDCKFLQARRGPELIRRSFAFLAPNQAKRPPPVTLDTFVTSTKPFGAQQPSLQHVQPPREASFNL